MSGLSLRDQLLQAGLVSEKQVKQAEQSQKRQNFTDRKQVGKKDRNFREEQRQAELQQQAAAKAASSMCAAMKKSICSLGSDRRPNRPFAAGPKCSAQPVA